LIITFKPDVIEKFWWHFWNQCPKIRSRTTKSHTIKF